MVDNDRHEDEFSGEDTKKWFPKQAKKEEVENPGPKFRAFLYHKDYPQGVIFTDASEFQQALFEGWVEAPWLTSEDPEKLKKHAKEKAEKDEREKKLQKDYEEKKLQEEFEAREKQRLEVQEAEKKVKKANGKKK